MGVLSFWPLALLVLVPVIIILYILRQEAKQQKFSSTMLWKEAFRNIQATKPWEKLKKNILLFLQILTVLLFILALMGPWLKSRNGGRRQVILVLDNSASMSSIYEGKQTRLEAAKAAACDYVDGLAAGTVINVISGGKDAVLVLSNSSDKLEVKRRIKEIGQTGFAGDLSVSLGLVESCANQAQDADIVFFTDTAFDTGGLSAAVASFYSKGENLAVGSVSCGWKEETLEVLISVRSYADKDVVREINLYGIDSSGKETLLDIPSVEIPAGETCSVFSELNAADAEGMVALRAELNGQDALEGDNEGWCVLEEVQTNRVLLLTKSNLFVEKAMNNLAGMEVYRSSDLDVLEDAEEYDLYIFDGMVPEKLPQSGNVMFINCDYPQIFEQSGSIEGKKLTLLQSDVTEYIAEKKFGVNKARIYTVPSWGTGYLEQDGNCVGFYGIYDGRRIAVMGFDLHQTDFGLQAEFPVLMSGLSYYLLGGSLTEKNSYTVGDSILLHGSTKGSDLTLSYPDSSTRTLEASEVSGSYIEITAPGLYGVSQKQEGREVRQHFAAAFPSVESAVGASVESAEDMIQQSEKVESVSTHTAIIELRNIVLILLLLLMLAEWFLYVRMQ